MKYNQPFGISDPESPYINGDPSTGTMGSIPPAASIEYPQREIVAAINAARKQDLSGPQYTPANTDLQQLARAIQSSLHTTARDTGTTNAYACALQPPLLAYFEGFQVIVKIGNTNTGPSVLNVNGLGNKNIINVDGSPLARSALRQNGYACFKYDGTSFQTVWASPGQVIKLTADLTLYVRTDGNDTTGDGSINDAAHAFRTIQRAIDYVAASFLIAGRTVTIQLGNAGTYTGNVSVRDVPGSIVINGNTGSVSSYIIQGAGGNVVVGMFGAGTNVTLQGVTITAVADFSVVECDYGASCTIVTCSFQGVSLSSIRSIIYTHAGSVTLRDVIHVWNAATGNVLAAYNGGEISIGQWFTQFNMHNNNMTSGFARCTSVGIIYIDSGFCTFTGSATGARFFLQLNSVLNTNSGGNLTYLPGNVAGVNDGTSVYN